MTKCPQCEFDGGESCTHRLRLQQMTCPAPFYDNLGRYHEHPGEYLEAYICDKGHRWEVTRPARKQCQPCAQGPVFETPNFPVNGGVRIDLEELERLKFERRERQRLINFFKYDANLTILEQVMNLPPLDGPGACAGPDFDSFSLAELTGLLEQYEYRKSAMWESSVEEQKQTESSELAEDAKQVVEEAGEAIADALEATNDLLSEFV